jgi:hypothetical protein
MVSKNIAIRWDEASIRGYTDLLPVGIIAPKANGSTVLHEVRGPRGGHYWAKCKVVFREDAADMDYAQFPRFNDKHNMELGILRILFTDASRRVIRRIEWKDANSKQFVPADVSVIPPHQLTSVQALYEGAAKRIQTQAFERDPRARRLCLAHYGSNCFVCGFDFERIYGNVAAGFIHVHHLTPLAKVRGRHAVDPVKHLRPVCPNCHAVLHLDPSLDVRRLKRMLSAATKRPGADVALRLPSLPSCKIARTPEGPHE